MTKQEIEKAIENGESVWAVYGDCIEEERFFDNEERVTKNVVDFNKIFKTKAEAEHYLHHANVTRTEHLPFITWEEFRKVKKLEFNGLYAGEVCEYRLSTNGDFSYIILWEDEDEDKTWECTEEKFYKAYDECVRLFKGE